jgi:hypothetical protein
MAMPCLLPQGPFHPGTASVDHFICAEQGLIGHSKGKLTTKSFQGGAVFIDTESGVCFVHLQTSIDAAQTILGKQAFKREMAKYDCVTIAYRADNGFFAGNAFKNKITKSEQSISYCGVGGHHQNALAENCIGILCQNALAMLLHATLLWPEALNTNLWPIALCISDDICNLQPREDGNCYLNFLSLSDVNPSFADYHPFGCPVVALDDHLSTAGDSIPKWEQSSWVGANLGNSKYHASIVPLVLNLKTSHVTSPFMFVLMMTSPLWSH